MYPFGNPDGSQASPESLDADFVPFANADIWGDIATKPTDLSARIFVGRKGCGKTHYLRRLQNHVQGLSGMFACDREVTPPDTYAVRLLARGVRSREEREEDWRSAWTCAIELAAASTIVFGSKWGSIERDTREQIDASYREILERIRPGGIFDHMGYLLHGARGISDINRLLRSDARPALREGIAKALRGSDQICFFVDNIDEHYMTDPAVWLDCEVGFFNAVVSLTRDNRFGGRLHIFATARDEVYTRYTQTEHGTRVATDSHIRVLEWRQDSIRHLLHEKIRKLEAQYLARPKSNDPMDRWLGVGEVYNASRKLTETVESYILRHTRLLPRDIVIVGNFVMLTTAGMRQFDANLIDDDPIVGGVARAAKYFAVEQVAVCANRIAAEAGSSYHRLAQALGGDGERHASRPAMMGEIARALRDLARDRISPARLSRFSERMTQLHGTDSMLDALWLTGLLGYRDKRDPDACHHFYSLWRTGDLQLPRGRVGYGLHSIVLDFAPIRAIGRPITSCLG